MECSEVEELVGAIALGALPAAEAIDVEQHLVDCATGHAELRELYEVVALLPLACDEVEPPSRLLGGILAAAVEGRAQALGGQGEGSDDSHRHGLVAKPKPSASPSITPFRTRSAWFSPFGLAAAAMLLIAIGLGAWNITLRRQIDDESAVASRQAKTLTALLSATALVPLNSDSGIAATFVQERDGSGSLVLSRVPAPPAGKVYEIWFIRDGKPTGAGLFASSQLGVLHLTGSPAGAQIVAVTLEPVGGSELPTSDPIALAKLG
jgi:hypothetical protein